ncbi:MAG TPA: hypothetical protein DD435_07520 [Cyanobacteria bacterium UBA8530]|nr:hypothetical protein [Cyanobacteria bacterium UBA8530]
MRIRERLNLIGVVLAFSVTSCALPATQISSPAPASRSIQTNVDSPVKAVDPQEKESLDKMTQQPLSEEDLKKQLPEKISTEDADKMLVKVDENKVAEIPQEEASTSAYTTQVRGFGGRGFGGRGIGMGRMGGFGRGFGFGRGSGFRNFFYGGLGIGSLGYYPYAYPYADPLAYASLSYYPLGSYYYPYYFNTAANVYSPYFYNYGSTSYYPFYYNTGRFYRPFYLSGRGFWGGRGSWGGRGVWGGRGFAGRRR